MRNLRYILLILSLCPALLWGQNRFSAAERSEYSLAGKGGFSKKESRSSTDVWFGLHASQYTGSHHLFGLSLEGSWSAFVHNMPTASFAPGGGAVGFHLLYEYQYSGTLVQTGLGINFQRVNTYCSDTTIYHEHVHDLWMGQDRQLILRHQFYDRHDVAQQFYGQLPVYAGHYFLSSAGVGYFLAGVHLNYLITGSTKQTLTGSTAGKYYDFIGVWEEMDNHGFRKDVPIERKGTQLNLKLDVMAHAEMGYEYTTSQNPHNYRVKRTDRIDCRLRFAGFVDFGILNICPKSDGVYYGTPEATIYDFPTYQMNHVFATKDAGDYWLRNLFVGVRLSVLFGVSSKERCILCDPKRY